MTGERMTGESKKKMTFIISSILACTVFLMGTATAAEPIPTTAPAGTAATEYFKCTMSDDATFEQIVAASEAMLKDARVAGIRDYELNLFVPLYDYDTSFGVFYWVGTSPSATRLGVYNDFWKADANRQNRDRFAHLIKQCDRAGVYWNRKVTVDK
jgi:hypothetical protein